ncbi:hypothetical protein DAPPUDRAFT_301828 [Daphnia pulex]|uniref:RNase H type-1 domain-containing protein n=1 Tax=Daphnia pulex TaxID=6669 RepID=E9GAH0_DAPPU|nr:hypothetical protein DAPPUDRAFT_301828 [Daphnia pulex]|eukprot:EFX83527.1 hypothetical protein DAPPUDRAFT_301828 [Daphnia pulex]
MNFPGFIFDSHDNVVTYIDGACPFNGYPHAKGGIGVWFGDDHPLNVSEPLDREGFPPTNQVAEIKACIRACQILKDFGVRRVSFYTDSQYLIDSMTNWIYKWLNNGWLKSDGTPLKHKHYYQELLDLIDNFKVNWVHIPSAENKADRLAKKGAEKY